MILRYVGVIGLLLAGLGSFSRYDPPFSQTPVISTARYTVTFQSTWSSVTHPVSFPNSPHYSGLVGATHNSNVQFWAPGGFASQGIESMAETGSKTAMLSEVGASADVGTTLSGGGINVSPGQVAYSFDIESSHSLVTLVSMLAPSPDWFVGVSSLDLYEGGSWVTERTVDLELFDAGTDSGLTYSPMNGNEDTQPREPITRMTDVSYDNPFKSNGIVGTFTFRLDTITTSEFQPAGSPTAFSLGDTYPNPTAEQVYIQVINVNGVPFTVEVFNVHGQLVMKHSVAGSSGTSQFELDTTRLPPGKYFLRAQQSDRVSTASFVKSR